MNIRDQYKKHCLTIDVIIGSFFALLLWIIWKIFFDPSIFVGSDIQLYANIAQLEATMLGFILATLGIVFTQLSNARFQSVRNHSSFNQLWKVYVSTIKYLGLGVLLAWTARIFGVNEILAFLNLWIISVSFLRVARCVWILEKIIKISLKQPPAVKVPDPNL